MLNIETSSAMEESLWKSIGKNVDKLSSCFGENDVIATIVFNQRVKLLSKLSI